MTNTVTVTVRMDGGDEASKSFDLDTGGGAPTPPDISGDDTGHTVQAADAPPPSINADASEGSLSADAAPPPEHDESASDVDDQNAAMIDVSDGPPPPKVKK